MTVMYTNVSTVKPGRGADAIALMKKIGDGVARNGGKNVRVMLNTNVSPPQIAVGYEAESNADIGKITDNVYADTAFMALWSEAAADDGPMGAGAGSTWVEV